MGSPKALLLRGGVPIVESLAGVFGSAKLDPVVVVASGPVFEHLAPARGPFRLVRGDPAGPMIDSVARGLLEMPDAVEAAVIQPVDAPFTDRAMIAALGSGDARLARVLCHLGRPGHPIQLPRSLFGAAIARPQGGLRAILEDTEVELVEWPDRRVLADLDSADDLAEWADELGGGLH
jgi:CTP:molybdopterin cytidylyltransferase MocA